MSKTLKKFAPQLRYLNKVNNKLRIKWLKKNCNKDFVNCVCECVKNILKGNVPLSDRQTKELKRRKLTLRKIIRKKLSLQNKRKIIQKGGFLGAILPPIISVLGGLLGSVFGRKN